jgi:hypothetical protein
MPPRRKRLAPSDTRFHAMKWDMARWKRMERATKRLQARSRPLKVTTADLLRLAMDAYLAQDEALEPAQLAS